MKPQAMRKGRQDEEGCVYEQVEDREIQPAVVEAELHPSDHGEGTEERESVQDPVQDLLTPLLEGVLRRRNLIGELIHGGHSTGTRSILSVSRRSCEA